MIPVGTRALVRLALRRDRIILPVWIALLSFIPASTASAYGALYPTLADRASVAAGAARNPSFSLLYGPAFDLTTPGGFTAWLRAKRRTCLIGGRPIRYSVSSTPSAGPSRTGAPAAGDGCDSDLAGESGSSEVIAAAAMFRFLR